MDKIVICLSIANFILIIAIGVYIAVKKDTLNSNFEKLNSRLLNIEFNNLRDITNKIIRIEEYLNIIPVHREAQDYYVIREAKE